MKQENEILVNENVPNGEQSFNADKIAKEAVKSVTITDAGFIADDIVSKADVANVADVHISLYTSFYCNDPMYRKIREIAELAKSDAVKSQTENYRQLLQTAENEATAVDKAVRAKEDAKKVKQKLPAFLTNVYCENGKKRSDIKHFLPFVGFDVDHISKERVRELMMWLLLNPHVVMAEPSVSGLGVHFVIRVDSDEWLNGQWDGKDIQPYEYVYAQAKAYVESTFLVEVDMKCKNPEHVFGICYDDDFYFNADAVALHIDTTSYNKVVQPAGHSPRLSTDRPFADNCTAGQIKAVADELISRRIDITDGYQNYLTLGFALAHEMGENGRQLYHDLCCMHPDYQQQECDRQYSNCLKSNGGGVTIKSFFHMAKEAGVDLSQIAREQLAAAPSYATNANTPCAKNKEKIEKSCFSVVSVNGMAGGTMAGMAQVDDIVVNDNASVSTGYTFSDKLNKDDLTGLMRTIYDKTHEEPQKCDTQMIGSLNVVSGIMGGANGSDESRSGVYGVYDGRRVYANLYNIVFSSAGSDKGPLVFCRKLAAPIRNEKRRKYEGEMKDYEVKKVEWDCSNKKERGAEPQKPTYQDPFVPGNSSSSAIYHTLHDNGGWGMIFETEADTVTSMLDSDYGNYSDTLRKAYHHEPISMNRTTDRVHIDIDEPRLSVFLTCTPGQLTSLFPSFENGLGSRFSFYNMPDDNVEFHDVFAQNDSPIEDTYRKLGDELLPLYHALQMRDGHPIQFVMSPNQQKEFLDTYRGVLQEQFQMLGKGIRAFIFRIALECFRYAMILSTLRKLAEWQENFDASDPEQESIFRDYENALVCDDRDFRTAMTIVGCLINHTAMVYATLAKETDNPFSKKGITLKPDELKVYSALPIGNFQTAQFIEITNGLNIPPRTAQRMLSNFVNKYHIINPISRGVYNKFVPKQE